MLYALSPLYVMRHDERVDMLRDADALRLLPHTLDAISLHAFIYLITAIDMLR